MLELHAVQAFDRWFSFLVENPDDHIQSFIRKGCLYEQEELQLILDHAGHPKRILDVGANIGTHSVVFAHCFDAIEVIPIEPNPAVLPLLKANVGLNWHRALDLSFVGVGLSNRSGEGYSSVASVRNLGGAKLVFQAGGEVPIARGDDILGGRRFDLIKIDVEGSELEVLAGLEATLRESNATVFLEVVLQNIDRAIQLMRRYGYSYSTSYQRYGRCINLLFEKTK